MFARARSFTCCEKECDERLTITAMFGTDLAKGLGRWNKRQAVESPKTTNINQTVPGPKRECTMAKRGRKPLNDPDSKTFTVSELSISPKVTAMEKDMYSNWLYWDGTASYFDPKAQMDATLPKGRRAAKFAVISEDESGAYTLRFDLTGHLDELERRSKAKK